MRRFCKCHNSGTMCKDSRQVIWCVSFVCPAILTQCPRFSQFVYVPEPESCQSADLAIWHAPFSHPSMQTCRRDLPSLADLRDGDFLIKFRGFFLCLRQLYLFTFASNRLLNFICDNVGNQAQEFSSGDCSCPIGCGSSRLGGETNGFVVITHTLQRCSQKSLGNINLCHYDRNFSITLVLL